MNSNRNISKQKRLITFLISFIFFTCLKSQVSFLTDYQIKNNTNLSVAIDFTVSCNQGRACTEAKLIFIPAGQTYTVPPPFFNSARNNADCDIIIQLAGRFGGEKVSCLNQSSRYNEDTGWFNTQNKLKPQGIIIWSPSITNIW
jgi:hypothetical protein